MPMMPKSPSGADASGRPAILVRLGSERDALFDRLVAELDEDDRVRAVWLGGSLGRGIADDWSDLDLGCVIRDDQFTDWLSDLDDLYRRLGKPVLVGPLRDLHGGGVGRSQSVLFTGIVSLDLDLLPSTMATRPVDTRTVFDRIDLPIGMPPPTDEQEWHRLTDEALDFFWSMAAIALKYIGRGATARAVTQIDLLADTFVRLWRLAHQPGRLGTGGANWLHPINDAELIRRLPQLGVVIEPGAALGMGESLMGQISLLHPLIAERGVTIPFRAVHEVESFLGAVEDLGIRHITAASDVGGRRAPTSDR